MNPLRRWWRQNPPQTDSRHRPEGQPSQANPGELAIEVERLIQTSDLTAARQLVDTALGSGTTSWRLLMGCAKLYRLSGMPQRGVELCEQALGLDLADMEVSLELSDCQLACLDAEAAAATLEAILAEHPHTGKVWSKLAGILIDQDRFREAEDAARQALRCGVDPEPERAQAWFYLGQSLHMQRRHPEAIEAFNESRTLDPQRIEVFVGLGHSHLFQDDEPEAVKWYEQAVQRSTRPSQNLLLNYGSALMHCGRIEEAHTLFSRISAENPGDHTARWYLCQLDLLLCRWEQGWNNFGARFAAGAIQYRPMPFRPWDGRAASGDILLIMADEGIGDEIMYASCFADAAERVGGVIVECEPRLKELFQRSFPRFTVVSSRRELDNRWLQGLPTPDWQIPSGDLPGLFRRSEASFPQHTGYLRAAPDRVTCWRQQLERDLGPGLKVGVSWRGGSAKTRTRARSLGAQHWGPILSLPGARFVNLQYGQYEEELRDMNELHGGGIVDYPQAIANYSETAALVSALDVVVTVCTAVVHLAGALGTRTFVLTPHTPGWRYSLGRESMPWYPSTRLFRQSTWGDWDAPCQEVSLALADLTNRGTRLPSSM